MRSIVVTGMTEKNDYRDHWQRYRRLRNINFVVVACYVPVTMAFALLGTWLLGSLVPGFVVAGAFMVTFMVLGIKLQAWRCPRCGKRFSAKWWYNKGLMARKCVHCGLPKYTESGEVETTLKL